MPSLTYLTLKAGALALRGLAKFLGSITAHPDEILSIPSRDGAQRPIRLHIYHPGLPNDSPKTPSPVLITFSGSGFVIRGHGLDDFYCRRIAQSTAYTVIDVDYRMAPENPCPCALQDAEDAVNWVLADPGRWDVARVAIGGFSAGAHLALATAAVSFPPGTFSALIAFYPAVEAATLPAETKDGEEGDAAAKKKKKVEMKEKVAPDPSGRPLPPWLVQFFSRCYVSDGAVKADDPRASPGRAELGRFPRNVCIITAAQDTLALEGEAFAEKLKEAPVYDERAASRKVVCERMDGVGHAWDKFVKEEQSVAHERRERAYGLVVEVLGYD